MSLLPVDVIGALHESLRANRRPEDGLLHCSNDLLGSLRHAQLRIAGAPTIASELTSDIILKTGTMWHEYVGEILVQRGVPVVRELSVTPWLPEGWAGTADYLFFDPEYQAWVLADLKTQKGESFFYLEKDGAKAEHIWQLSAYYHALVAAGFEIVEGFSIIYLPKNDTATRDGVEPYVADCMPLPADVIKERMVERWDALIEYMANRDPECSDGDYITDYLSPPMERVQSYWWNAKQKVFDVKLRPHWSAEFCPYPDDLCDCNTQGINKIGHYSLAGKELIYEPRKNYEDIAPLVEPTEKEARKRYA